MFKRLAKALIRLHVGWSEPLLIVHTTLLEISCHCSNDIQYSFDCKCRMNSASFNGYILHMYYLWEPSGSVVWSEPLLVAHTTSLEISCHGSNDIQYSFDCKCRMNSASFNGYILHMYYLGEPSGSVVGCLTRDRGATGSSLTSVTALWSFSKTHLSYLSTGSTQEDLSLFKIVDGT